MKSRLSSRNKIRDRQYALAFERDEAINHRCAHCAIGIPNGTQVATEFHEIVSKSQLPGTPNYRFLFALQNIIGTCRFHHTYFEDYQWLNMKAMVKLRLAKPADYRQSPWNTYWDERLCPVTFDCLGMYGYGNKFRWWNHNGFWKIPGGIMMAFGDPGTSDHFCGVCPKQKLCRKLTEETNERKNTKATVP